MTLPAAAGLGSQVHVWVGVAVLALTLWGIVVFGLALDRYAASFWPSEPS